MTGCTKSDNPISDNPNPIDVSAMEKELVGLWWDEYEYADVTEAGAPFTRVLLAVLAEADHSDDGDDNVHGDGSYAKGMTDVSSTSVSLADGSMTVTNGEYSGTLEKADAGQQTEIQNALTLSAASADGTTGTYTDSKGQSRDCIVVTLNGTKTRTPTRGTSGSTAACRLPLWATRPSTAA